MNTQRRRTHQSKLANRRAVLPLPTNQYFPEGGAMRMEGETLVVITGGKESRYAFDYGKNAYKLLPEETA